MSGPSSPAVSLGGCSRSGAPGINRDAFAARQPEDVELLRHRGIVLAMADGVSSSPVSRDASELAVTEFIEEYYAAGSTRSVSDCAAAVLATLNGWLYAQNAGSRSGLVAHDGLVTTFTGLIIKSCTAFVFHIGDSRLLLLRDGELLPLSQDHVRRHNGRLLLSRALGLEQKAEIDHARHALREGDLVVLATDGLFDGPAGTLSNDAMRKLIERMLAEASDDLEATAASLVRVAGERGCDDDASCLLARIDTLPYESEVEARQRVTALAIPPALDAGMVIDGLEVLGTLHQSSRSHVYRVRRQSDGQVLVLKAPSLNLADDALYLDGFVRERWLLQRLDHPGLLRGVESACDTRFLYLLTECLSGQSLRAWMLDNPQPTLARVRPLLESIVDALRALQHAGITHRDLKPENIIIELAENSAGKRATGPAERCVLIDFGTARVDGLEELQSVLQEETPVGAVHYTAPESVLFGHADRRSDLFSLGCIAYEMLSGSLPYDMSSSRLRRPVNQSAWHYRSLRHQRLDMPGWIDITLQKATSPYPEHRHPAFSEFLAEMKNPSGEARRREAGLPLMERNPLRFWQGVSLALSLALIAALVW